MDLSKAWSSFKKGFGRRSPEILTGIGIGGFITAAVMVGKVTPRVVYLLEEEKDEKGKDLTKLETVKIAWKYYIPSAAVATISTACIVYASSTNIKRNAALATAYSLSETAFRTYQDKVIETIGETKEQEIKDQIDKDKVDAHPSSQTTVLVTSYGDTLCYDVVRDKYFKSSIEKIRRAENDLNRRMRDDMYISLNDFWSEIGLTTTDLGDQLGWNIETGYIDISFSSQLSDEGVPCLVIDYKVSPKYDYK